jgi:cytochrome d ubiquinol oxidase subunit II
VNAWLPFVFLALMGLAVLLYVLLDGYDLGVGMLMRRADPGDRDRMVASIGPFWDANETWLVLGVGLLLVAFPAAHGIILGKLYLPVAAMLAGLILRGVAFDFRIKAHDQHRAAWNNAFHAGSIIAAWSQGFMLGRWLLGFASGATALAFAGFIGLCLMAGYCLLGACWLVMKSEGALQAHATRWARLSLWLTGVGIVAVSLATPLVSTRIFDRWFTPAHLLLLSPIPVLTLLLFAACDRSLRRRIAGHSPADWHPLACAMGMFVLSFAGLAYSLFPYLVVDKLTYLQAASAPESLRFMLVGVAITLPAILGYTAYSYRVFGGKTRELRY